MCVMKTTGLRFNSSRCFTGSATAERSAVSSRRPVGCLASRQREDGDRRVADASAEDRTATAEREESAAGDNAPMTPEEASATWDRLIGRLEREADLLARAQKTPAELQSDVIRQQLEEKARKVDGA